jgi:hypothetical protein
MDSIHGVEKKSVRMVLNPHRPLELSWGSDSLSLRLIGESSELDWSIPKKLQSEL